MRIFCRSFFVDKSALLCYDVGSKEYMVLRGGKHGEKQDKSSDF